MRHLPRHFFIVAGLALGVAVANASDLGPGSPAPALEVNKWYKGTPVKTLDKNKTYVVEFWATWCGPCIESIPHVTELAKKNKDVTFIGVSIWEEDEGTKIKDFIAKMGDKMDYNIGYSGNQTGMAQSWMASAGPNGIPAAFIIKNGQIQWIGHPMTMEKPLAEIKAGTWNLNEFKKEFDKEVAATRQQMEIQKQIAAVRVLVDAGKYAEAKAKLDEIDGKYSAAKGMTKMARFQLIAKENPTAWEAQAKQYATNKEDAQLLFGFAMQQTQKGGNLALGAKAIEIALEKVDDNDLLAFYNGANFYYAAKDYKRALPLADKAVAALPNSQYKNNEQAKTAVKKLRDEIAAKAAAG